MSPSPQLDLSPPELPEPTLLDSLLRWGLLLGAVFQLLCILAAAMPMPAPAAAAGRQGHQDEAESNDVRAAEPTKKPKAATAPTRQKAKKESKKKR